MKDKYIDKKYFKLSEYFGLPDELGMVGFISFIKEFLQSNKLPTIVLKEIIYSFITFFYYLSYL